MRGGFRTANRSYRFSQSASLIANNSGRRCGECETFSKCRSGFCPKIEIEISRDHPACQMFASPQILGDWRRSSEANGYSSSNNNHNLGLHLKAYSNGSDCKGPKPEYCTVYCSKYWTCQLVIDEVKKRQ